MQTLSASRRKEEDLCFLQMFCNLPDWLAQFYFPALHLGVKNAIIKLKGRVMKGVWELWRKPSHR